MNHRVVFTTLLILMMVVLPGATTFAGQAPSSKWGDCVAVLPGQRDDLAGTFAAMNIPYRVITSAQVKDDAFLDKLCALFLSSDSAAGRDAAPHIAQWVERGGLLYVSGSELDVLLDAFPRRLTFGGRASPGLVGVKLNDPGLAATIDEKEATLQIPTEGWPIIAQGKSATHVHVYARRDSSDAPLIVSFDAGKGWVVYSALAAGADTSKTQQSLIQFFVMRTLFAQDAAQLLRRFPASFTAPTQIADTTQSPGEYTYTAREGDDWDAALLWNGGTFSLTLRSSYTATSAQQGNASPLVVPVRNGTSGEWKISVRGVDVPSANTPFLLMIIPRRGTQLLNAVPTPLQVSRDVNVLAGNLGLAVAMAILLALGASLFADTAAERKGSGNRMLAALGGAAGQVGGTLRSLFTPTTWPVPPLARRLAATIELAVFLALTALVASLLDPRFAPTSTRGVGIFAAMFISLAVSTFAFALAQSSTARTFGVAGVFQVRPGYLLIAAACVVVSRLIGFVPGFLFGLPAGFAVLGALEGAKRRDGMLALVALVVPLAVGAIAWILAIPTDLALRGLAEGQMNATLSSGLTTVVGALQAGFLLVFFVALWQTFFELFPIAGLNGWTLFTRGRAVWFLAFVITAFLTIHILINPNATILDAPKNRMLLLIVVMLAIYSAVAVGTWLLFNAGRLRGEGTT
ncbi:MAG: hypothetical protein H6R36_210, partial [Chloroflexi bacterium]|nr:hypothetical protein [Chloroflexota bacterium]